MAVKMGYFVLYSISEFSSLQTSLSLFFCCMYASETDIQDSHICGSLLDTCKNDKCNRFHRTKPLVIWKNHLFTRISVTAHPFFVCFVQASPPNMEDDPFNEYGRNVMVIHKQLVMGARNSWEKNRAGLFIADRYPYYIGDGESVECSPRKLPPAPPHFYLPHLLVHTVGKVGIRRMWQEMAERP